MCVQRKRETSKDIFPLHVPRGSWERRLITLQVLRHNSYLMSDDGCGRLPPEWRPVKLTVKCSIISLLTSLVVTTAMSFWKRKLFFFDFQCSVMTVMYCTQAMKSCRINNTHTVTLQRPLQQGMSYSSYFWALFFPSIFLFIFLTRDCLYGKFSTPLFVMTGRSSDGVSLWSFAAGQSILSPTLSEPAASNYTVITSTCRC